MRRTE
jgi:hypothetical protein